LGTTGGEPGLRVGADGEDAFGDEGRISSMRGTRHAPVCLGADEPEQVES
jgi:hypothetical protein